jgi:hypothetical protein
MDFPRLVYTSPGPAECQGGTYGCKAVEDEEQLAMALEVGFFATLPEALKGEADVTPEPETKFNLDGE